MEINKDAIDSIFVELQDDDFVVLPEIGTDIVSIEIIYKAEYYFKYEEIEEPVSIFVDYMKEIWVKLLLIMILNMFFTGMGIEKKMGMSHLIVILKYLILK